MKPSAEAHSLLLIHFLLLCLHTSGWIMFRVFLCSDRHDALFVVGSLDETLELRGLRYHPIDIETSVSRAHRSIAER